LWDCYVVKLGDSLATPSLMGNLLGTEDSPQPDANVTAQEQQRDSSNRASRKSESSGTTPTKRRSPEEAAAAKEARDAERRAEAEARRQRKEEKEREEREEEARCLSEAAFEALDVQGTGFVTQAELEKWLTSEPYFKARNVGASPQALLDVLDKDKDGKVSGEEFVRVFSRLKDIEQMTSQLLLNANNWHESEPAGGSPKPKTFVAGSPRASRKAGAGAGGGAGASSRALPAASDAPPAIAVAVADSKAAS